MRVSLLVFLSAVLLLACVPLCWSLPNSAVIADATIHLLPPHDGTVTQGCSDPSCGTLSVGGLAADGGWLPSGSATVKVNVPNGMIGFLIYAAAPNGKHVGSLQATQGNAQLFDDATPPGSTLQHVSKAVQNQLVATWTAPASDGESTVITFTALILESMSRGYILTVDVQQSNTVSLVAALPLPLRLPQQHSGIAGAGTVHAAAAPAAAAAAAANVKCLLTVPANPLTAAGLATPYILATDNTGNTACSMATAASQAFVQGAIIDTATGKISIYNPLVITTGTTAAVAPTVPTLPANNVVALWFGFNGNTLTLQNAANTNSLKQGKCVNGVANSPFGTFAYCNAPAFFNAVQKALEKGKIATAANAAAVQKKTGVAPAVVVPAPGKAVDGKNCPTLRDFLVVDQHQSDGTDVTYLVTAKGQVAQNTAANRKALAATAANPAPTIAINPANNALLTTLLNPALKCAPGFQAPDLADANNMVNALPLSEIQAALFQAFPVARVPAGDTLVLVNAKPNVQKLNNYRLGVAQFPVKNVKHASTACYCKNMVKVAPKRLMANQAALTAAPSFVAGMNLFQFMVTRFNTAVGANGLNCAQFGVKSPFVVNANAANGKAIVPGAHPDALDIDADLPLAMAADGGSDNDSEMTVQDAYGNYGDMTIGADPNMLASFDAMVMPSMEENMDHNNGIGAEMEAFANPNIDALITDPGIDNGGDSTPFAQTAAGMAVIIVVSVVGLTAIIGLAVFLYQRKQKQRANAVSSAVPMTAVTTA